MVCHHGAGHSALTFALMAREVTELSREQCGVLALDCRGHGALVIRLISSTTQYLGCLQERQSQRYLGLDLRAARKTSQSRHSRPIL